MRRKGFLRIEVQVHSDDAALVRGVVNALADPAHAADARAILREHFAARQATGLKELLAAAPLDGINLESPRDLDRPVDL